MPSSTPPDSPSGKPNLRRMKHWSPRRPTTDDQLAMDYEVMVDLPNMKSAFVSTFTLDPGMLNTIRCRLEEEGAQVSLLQHSEGLGETLTYRGYTSTCTSPRTLGKSCNVYTVLLVTRSRFERPARPGSGALRGTGNPQRVPHGGRSWVGSRNTISRKTSTPRRIPRASPIPPPMDSKSGRDDSTSSRCTPRSPSFSRTISYDSTSRRGI
jgi:hypothetical protein